VCLDRVERDALWFRHGIASASLRALFHRFVHRESGAIASTRFHSTARLPLMPSATVANTCQVAADLALVRDARRPAGAWQNAETELRGS
jgi:hypothetical protein